MPIRKVVIIGPESTGKSSLCEGLAAHYQSDWVPEYAREYLQAHGISYRYEDLTTIARGQLALEDRHAAALEDSHAVVLAGRASGHAAALAAGRATGHQGVDPILFVDTDMYVMKVWSEFVFGRCESWILEQIATRRYDAYLLCRTDLPWVKDDLREYPDLVSREKLFNIYRDSLIRQGTPWEEIGGTGDQRLEAAVAAVNRMIGPGDPQPLL